MRRLEFKMVCKLEKSPKVRLPRSRPGVRGALCRGSNYRPRSEGQDKEHGCLRIVGLCLCGLPLWGSGWGVRQCNKLLMGWGQCRQRLRVGNGPAVMVEATSLLSTTDTALLKTEAIQAQEELEHCTDYHPLPSSICFDAFG